MGLHEHRLRAGECRQHRLPAAVGRQARVGSAGTAVGGGVVEGLVDLAQPLCRQPLQLVGTRQHRRAQQRGIQPQRRQHHVEPDGRCDGHVVPAPAVQLHQRCGAGDQPATAGARHHQRGQHAVAARHRQQLAVSVDGHQRSGIGVDGAHFRRVDGGAHSLHLGQPERAVGGDEAGVDMLARQVQALRVGGHRKRGVGCADGDDAAALDQQPAVGDVRPVDRVQRGAGEQQRALLRWRRDLVGRGGRAGHHSHHHSHQHGHHRRAHHSGSPSRQQGRQHRLLDAHFADWVSHGRPSVHSCQAAPPQ